MEHVVIIGNGIAGITTARHVRKRSDHCVTVISGETDHFFSRTALMYIYMGHMTYEHTKPYEDWFWEKNRIELKKAWVEEVHSDARELLLSTGETIGYDKLVLATGSKPNKFGWPGQELQGVQGLYSYQDLELMETNTKEIERAVIVGGGLIGIEMAEMLRSRNIPVTFLVRESSFWDNVLPYDESQMINRHIREHHVDLRLGTELKEILSDATGKVRAVVTGSGEEIKCQFVGLTAGVSPNVEFLRKTEIEINRGVLVDQQLKTSVDNVYAAGDCVEFRKAPAGRKSIEQVWYTGRMMGEALAATLTGNPTPYQPGHWFNSAKFFDIEYQTYGVVLPQKEENEAGFYWEHENGKVALHLRWNKRTKKLIGVNNFGFRLRHHILDQWLQKGKTIDYAVEHLRDANFDPEFYKSHEEQIIAQFNLENGTTLSLKKRSWKRILEFVS